LELQESNLDDSEPEVEIPPPKKTKPNYDLTRKFQMVWAAQCHWAEMKLRAEGLLYMVRCGFVIHGLLSNVPNCWKEGGFDGAKIEYFEASC